MSSSEGGPAGSWQLDLFGSLDHEPPPAADRDRTAVAQDAARLLRHAADLAERGEIAEAAALQHRIAEVLTGTAVSPRSSAVPPPGPPAVLPDRAPPVRTIVIAVLTELGVASSPREIARYAQARRQVRLASRAFASLRRDEQRAWRSARSHQPVYIVPALTVAPPQRLVAVRARLALSAWPLERRLLGPFSERVDQLAVTAALAQQLARLRAARAPEAAPVAALVASYATAISAAPAAALPPDPLLVERAAHAALELIVDVDHDWRHAAASTARHALPPEEQLWGAATPLPGTDA